MTLSESFENLLSVKKCYFQTLEQGGWMRGSWGLEDRQGRGLHLAFLTLAVSTQDHDDLARELASHIKLLKHVKIQKPLCSSL